MTPESVLLGFGIDDAFTIVIIVAGLISAISKAIAQQREEKARLERKTTQTVDAAEEIAAPAAGQVRPKRANPLEAEIGDFLRRAAKGRAAGGAGSMIPPVAAKPAVPRPVRPVQSQPIRPIAVEAEVVEVPMAAEVLEPARREVIGQIATAVAKDVNTAEFRQRAKQLGKETRAAAHALERQVHKKFDRQVGALAGGAALPLSSKQPAAIPATSAIPATAAAEIAAMFYNANEVREAIILNEILTRPSERW